jgi:hypothetical protein
MIGVDEAPAGLNPRLLGVFNEPALELPAAATSRNASNVVFMVLVSSCRAGSGARLPRNP